jgi:hypothetical protein
VLARIPQEFRAGPEDKPARWTADPTRLLRVCDAAAQRLASLPAGMPSLRLLADQTAEVLAGLSRALNGLTLLVADPARPVPWGSRVRLRVPDWLPSLVNAGRALVVIGAAELFWIVTEWPNGPQTITFAAIGVILFAPRADLAYATAKGFMVGMASPPLFPRSSDLRCCRTGRRFSRSALKSGLSLCPAAPGWRSRGRRQRFPPWQ